jgi:hypothetical protein
MEGRKTRMTNEPLDWMVLANKKAKGKRPDFFDKPEDDRIYSILMSLVGEVSVMRTRLDTVERLLEAKGTISREDIENFAPEKRAGYERGMLIREYILRIMRGPIQAMQGLEQTEKPIDKVSRELKDI